MLLGNIQGLGENHIQNPCLGFDASFGVLYFSSRGQLVTTPELSSLNADFAEAVEMNDNLQASRMPWHSSRHGCFGLD